MGRGLPEKGLKIFGWKGFPHAQELPRRLPGGGGPEMTGVQCEPVPRPLSSRSPAGRCACQAGGGTLSSGQGARVADSARPSRACLLTRPTTSGAPVCRWGAGPGKVERVPLQEAVSTVWTRTARRLRPARYRLPGLYPREPTPSPHLTFGTISSRVLCPTPHAPEVSPSDLCSPGPPK